ALTADIVESVKERQQVVEVLESLKFRSRDRAVGWLRHEISPPEWQPLCLAESIAQILCRTDVVRSPGRATPAVALRRRNRGRPWRVPGGDGGVPAGGRWGGRHRSRAQSGWRRACSPGPYR